MKTAVVNAFLGLAALTLAACGTPEMTTDPSTGADVTPSQPQQPRPLTHSISGPLLPISVVIRSL